MILFLDSKEAKFIKLVLSYERASVNEKHVRMIDRIVNRIEKCEELQKANRN